MINPILNNFSEEELAKALIRRPSFVGVVIRQHGEEATMSKPNEQAKETTLALLTEALDVTNRSE